MLIGGRETVGRWKKCRELAFLNNVSRRWIQFNYLGIAMTSSAEKSNYFVIITLENSNGNWSYPS
jgi:hypothetical protein